MQKNNAKLTPFIAGSDLLIGGAGNDVIEGNDDGDSTSSTADDWLSTGAYAAYDFLTPDTAQWEMPINDTAGDVIYAGAGSDYVAGCNGNDVIFGETGNDALIGFGGNDIILGGTENDFIYGDMAWGVASVAPGNDYLDGGDGNDMITGNEGDDILIGGKDDDTLYGGAGQDTYIYNAGDGIDTIYDTKADHNILRFGAGVDQKNIHLHLGSLMLDLGNGDAVHIGNFDQNDVFNSSSITSFEFADGSTLTTAELLARGFDIDGTSGNDTGISAIAGTNTTDRINGLAGDDQIFGMAGDDTLNGGDGSDQLIGDDGASLAGGNDTLNGGAGNDYLWGNGGDDTLAGGAGNDYLLGEAGDDTYVFNSGDGADFLDDASGANTLRFGAGITPESLSILFSDPIKYPASAMVIKYGADQVNLSWNSIGTIQRYEFGDGRSFDLAGLLDMGALRSPLHLDNTYYGTSGNDYLQAGPAETRLFGLSGDDYLGSSLAGAELHGGAGNDQLSAQGGNSTLDGGAGNDVLEGRGNGDDRLRWRTRAAIINSGKAANDETANAWRVAA